MPPFFSYIGVNMQIFLPALAVLFIGLKLTGVIMWSWWLVLLPLYGGFALLCLLFCAGVISAAFTKHPF